MARSTRYTATTMNDVDIAEHLWVFGYGSLIWRPDFEHVHAHPATLHGWARRFWQGSHDHRGTPDLPGRVVTLVPEPDAACIGVAFEIRHDRERILAALDHREKNGYERRAVPLDLDDGRRVPGLVYVAPEGNPAWRGPDTPARMAEDIATARGPSGSNRDYLLELAAALASRGIEEPEIAELAARVGGPPR